VSAATRACKDRWMPRRRARDADVVWSSTDGDRRARPSLVKAVPASGGRVKVRREVAGRRGKPVTTIAGLPLDDAGLRALASRLKRRCGVGGSVRDGVIELQGDHRPVVMDELRAAGYDAVLAGG
jgi:translation initiation factor 1